jgi:hypothetical protein
MRSNPRKPGLPMRLLVAGLVLVASCGVFEPRDSEAPEEGSGGSVYIQPQEPAVVISNLVTVMAEAPHTNYPELFAEDFTFVPDPDDVLTLESIYGQGVFDDWDVDVEIQVGERLFGRYFLALLELSGGTVIEDTDSTYTVVHEYRFDILGDQGWSNFRGAANFRIKRDPSDNLWYIYQWEDFRTESSDSTGIDGTWGLRKGEIRATT